MRRGALRLAAACAVWLGLSHCGDPAPATPTDAATAFDLAAPDLPGPADAAEGDGLDDAAADDTAAVDGGGDDAGATADGAVAQDGALTDATADGIADGQGDAGPDAAPDGQADTAGDADTADAQPDVPPPPCQVDADCHGVIQPGACQLPKCDVATGKCGTQPAPKYWPCDDGDPCSLGELCIGGKCDPDAGAVRDCDDGSPCTLDGCDTTAPGADASGCVHLAKDGGLCSDGNACTNGDKCSAGACVGTVSEACKCATDDDCLPFEDGNLCNGKLACKAKVCAWDASTVIACSADAGGACLEQQCNPKTGQCVKAPVVDGTPCDDGQPCTKGDECEAGKCTTGTTFCTCGSDADCAVFDDGNACNGVLGCFSGKCKEKPGSVVTCASKGGCVDNLCNPGSGKCEQAIKAEGAECEDGNLCTVGDVCVNQVCQGGALNTCDDGNPCTTDFCAGSCGHVPKSNVTCEDGDLCTSGEACVAGECIGGKAVDCDDKNPCTADTCAVKKGCEHLQLASGCDDLDACTEGEKCSNGSCVGGAPAACDDKNPCTLDSCDQAQGCVHVASKGFCATGDFCTSPGTCQDAKCVPAKNKCVDCVVDKDCLGQDDGNLCNGTPVCKAGECVEDPSTAVVCDKSADTACIVTFCNAMTGQCQQAAAPAGTKCDDGNACSANDVCQAGLCKSGVPATQPGCPGDVCGDGYCNKAKESCTNCQNDCGLCFNDCGDGKCAYFDPEGTQQETCSGCQTDCGKCDAGCKAAAMLFCGSNTLWSTGHPGATDGLNALGGLCSGSMQGNEFAYAFTGKCTGPITLQLVPQDPKQVLRVAVLDGATGCTSAACIGASTAGSGTQELKVDVVKGKLYYVVVDSEAKPGDYQLQLGCACEGQPICGDGKCDPKNEDCGACAKDCGACNPCGDGKCQSGVEDCKSCALDCGACAGCGDGKCVAGAEDCQACPADCGACQACGDGKCDVAGGEDCATCKLDCGACPTTCQPLPLPLVCGSQVKGAVTGAGTTKIIDKWQCLGGNHLGKEVAYDFTPSCTGIGFVKVVRDPGQLGNIDVLVVDKGQKCDGSSCLAFGPMLNGTAVATFQAEKGKTYTVVLDSTSNATASFVLQAQCIGCQEGCGNQVCEKDEGETCSSCLADCGLCSGCGDAKCEGNETCQTCPGDCGQCPYCGDGLCNDKNGETCQTCVKDCGKCQAGPVCGDAKCDGGETCTSCAKDCGACPPSTDGCSAGTKPGCGGCACEACVCQLDDYCCTGAWTNYCVQLCKNNCGGKCQ